MDNSRTEAIRKLAGDALANAADHMMQADHEVRPEIMMNYRMTANAELLVAIFYQNELTNDFLARQVELLERQMGVRDGR